MTYDLIIVSKSTTDLIPVTQRCIDSAKYDNANLNIIVVETGQPYKYDVNKIIEYNGEFNYNRALNLGLKHIKNEIHILANNDIIFRPGWSAIGDMMKANGYHSASALDSKQKFQRGNFVFDSYAIGDGMNGWCIFIDDFVIEHIGRLDETMTFWFSDNLYACQLMAAGIKHGLFTGVQVDHLESRTLKKQPHRLQRRYQIGELQKYNQRLQEYAEGKRLYQTNISHL